MIRSFLSSLLIGVFGMSLAGCGSFVSNEEYVLEQLEKKYNETFVVDKLQILNRVDMYYTAICYPIEQPDLMFEARANFKEDIVEDNYVSKRVFRKISDVIGENMDNLNGYFYIYSEPIVESRKLTDPEMSVKEYLTLYPNSNINVNFYYVPEQMDVDAFYKAMTGVFNGLENIDGRVYIYIVDEEHLNRIQSYLESVDTIYDEHKPMTKPFYKGYVKVNKGVIQCDRDTFATMLEDK